MEFPFVSESDELCPLGTHASGSGHLKSGAERLRARRRISFELDRRNLRLSV
jgi:hypothetical protein